MNTLQAKLFEEIYEIAPDWLKQKDLERDFLMTVLELARKETPFYKMLLLWEESDLKDRKEILADLEDMVEEYHDRPLTPVELPYIKMDKLASIADEVKKYKDFLRERVSRAGGVSVVAHKCKMAQPSLSRFLNTTSLPRKSTLEKLAKVLGLSQKEMGFEWTK